MRCDTLGGDYTETAIRERIAGLRVPAPVGRASAPSTPRRPSLLIDIQTKMQEGKGKGYERWAKLQNLRSMAQTLIFLQEKGLDDYTVLKDKSSAATVRFNELSDRIKDLDARLSANATLQKQIVTYSKTRDTYVAYQKAGYSKKFKAEHEADIILHQAAKKFFDDLDYGRDKKLPTIAALRAEYATMLAEKKKARGEYQQAKTEMRELLTARNNVDRLFSAGQPSERDHDRPVKLDVSAVIDIVQTIGETHGDSANIGQHWNLMLPHLPVAVTESLKPKMRDTFAPATDALFITKSRGRTTVRSLQSVVKNMPKMQ